MQYRTRLLLQGIGRADDALAPGWAGAGKGAGCAAGERLVVQRGMTMVELMVVVAILAILIGVASPSMARFVADWRATSAVNALTSSLRVARAEAVARTKPVVMCRVPDDSSTACESDATSGNGYASGWIVFVNNDLDASFSYSATDDELLLRQAALSGIARIAPTAGSRFVFQPNGLLRANANSINVDAKGFVSTTATPWARKALCISMPGRIRHVADTGSC